MLNATVKHYDMEVDFFKQFLDPYMKYTSGLFESDDEDLSVATRRMLDAIIEAAGLGEHSKVLEVGPGWGAFLKRVQERRIGVSYASVSPSEVQNTFIKTFARNPHAVHTNTFESWSRQAQSKKYDAIILIGSFCHLSNKAEQLKTMRDMLNDSGVVVIEDTFFITEEDHQNHASNEATRFVQEKIFGFAEILPLEQQLEQIQGSGLRLVSMLEHSDSYKLTIRRWIKNLKAMSPEQYPNVKDFIKYMTIAQRGWSNTIHNQLLVLKKV